MAKVIREELIRQLAGGDFVSGQALGDKLGVSRTAISKHINALSEIGLDVFKVSGKGYKLANKLHLLEQKQICVLLGQNDLHNAIEVHTLIDSTNSYLMRKLSSNPETGTVCIAEHQSAGRGRRGRRWESPFGSHLYLSMYWQLEQGISAAMGLSLVTALAVSDTLKSLYNLDAQLKWPNDVYLGGVKLAGILIELEGQSSGPSHSVIGIGLNVDMPKESHAAIDQPWTDIKSHTSAVINRNELAATLVAKLTQRLEAHQNHGFAPMLEDWHKRDLYFNQAVRLLTGERETKGICRGVNGQGALLLEVDGKMQPVYGGEVSLRKQNETIN